MANARPRPLHLRDSGCTGAWVGPKVDMDGWGKSRPSPMLDPRTVQTKVIPYTNFAIPVHNQYQQQGQEICSYITQLKIRR